MDLVWAGLREAGRLIVTLDPEILRITLLTLRVSALATAISLAIGLPLGVILALAEFPGRRFVLSVVNAGMGLPPVTVGLFVTVLLWRQGGLLGALGWMYTAKAMVLAQVVIATPLVVGLSLVALQALPATLRVQLLALGASPLQAALLMAWQARLGILAAVMAGFGGAVSEVGASMMVGGNIVGETRVLTTAIVLENGKGNFDVAIALSLILGALTYGVTALLTVFQQRRAGET